MMATKKELKNMRFKCKRCNKAIDYLGIIWDQHGIGTANIQRICLECAKEIERNKK